MLDLKIRRMPMARKGATGTRHMAVFIALWAFDEGRWPLRNYHQRNIPQRHRLLGIYWIGCGCCCFCNY